jgi:hypothetical protein
LGQLPLSVIALAQSKASRVFTQILKGRLEKERQILSAISPVTWHSSKNITLAHINAVKTDWHRLPKSKNNFILQTPAIFKLSL